MLSSTPRQGSLSVDGAIIGSQDSKDSAQIESTRSGKSQTAESVDSKESAPNPDEPLIDLNNLPAESEGKNQLTSKISWEKIKSSRVFKECMAWVKSLTITVVVVYVITYFIVPVAVVGHSMTPTLQDGQYLVMLKHPKTELSRGDIVVAKSPRFGIIIKRVIGVPGDEVDIDLKTGSVILNGQMLEEDYISEPIKILEDFTEPVEIPEGKYFLMGDNRNGSKDSRSSKIGLVSEDEIMGKIVF